MSVSRTHEDQCLDRIRQTLDENVRSLPVSSVEAARLDVLEAAASALGGFRLGKYWKRFKAEPELSERQAIRVAGACLPQIRSLPLHSALALSALARPRLHPLEQRSAGAYHTDFRLATYGAASLGEWLRPNCRVVDPACGSGILLVGATLQALSKKRIKVDAWLASSVYAADLSAASLRGARLALASLTDNVDALVEMSSHWFRGDSLLADPELLAGHAAEGFDVVVGNPPWEKLKATRHEFLQANGTERHYGADYITLDEDSYLQHRLERSAYAQTLMARYPIMGGGEPDLYKPFLELSLRLARPGGRVAIFVPAGLIRSQGTEALRRYLVDSSDEIDITVLENRARFFAIDTRFKFLLVSATHRAQGRSTQHPAIKLSHGAGDGHGVAVNDHVRIEIKDLVEVRDDLTIPEVRSNKEWNLFQSFARRGAPWNSADSEWHPEIVREIDMTRDRRHFLRSPSSEAMPLVEGRMIHQHRFGSKGYRLGSGRRARWQTLAMGRNAVEPQFWYPANELNPAVCRRTRQFRAGFCDITGQTNERSMLAALIPAGVVCGNKVPTVTFLNDPTVERLDLWLGIVNSLPFDWMLRRVITTTVNYFLLLSVPLPDIRLPGAVGKQIIQCTRELRELDGGSRKVNLWQAAELRAQIDVAVLEAYGGDAADMETILSDFPLLDRGQPPAVGESESTITRDLVLSKAHQRTKGTAQFYRNRIEAARQAGACAYIPAQYLAHTAEDSEIVCHA